MPMRKDISANLREADVQSSTMSVSDAQLCNSQTFTEVNTQYEITHNNTYRQSKTLIYLFLYLYMQCKSSLIEF